MPEKELNLGTSSARTEKYRQPRMIVFQHKSDDDSGIK